MNTQNSVKIARRSGSEVNGEDEAFFGLEPHRLARCFGAASSNCFTVGSPSPSFQVAGDTLGNFSGRRS